jgi:hypothetical protein
MVVVKRTLHTEATRLLCNSRHFTITLDAQFVSAVIWRRHKNFNSYVRSYRGTSCAEDQSTIQGDIIGKASFCVISSVTPLENDREPQRISDCGSSLQTGLIEEAAIHA